MNDNRRCVVISIGLFLIQLAIIVGICNERNYYYHKLENLQTEGFSLGYVKHITGEWEWIRK